MRLASVSWFDPISSLENLRVAKLAVYNQQSGKGLKTQFQFKENFIQCSSSWSEKVSHCGLKIANISSLTSFDSPLLLIHLLWSRVKLMKLLLYSSFIHLPKSCVIQIMLFKSDVMQHVLNSTSTTFGAVC